MASAATVAPAANTTNTNFGHGCNPWQREHWNLNGRNKVAAVYLGNTYTYKVTFKQFGSCLGGTLTDSYFLPAGTSGPVFGTINRNHVTFSFRYPSGSVQGTRTFTGTINRWGFVSGTWSETGTEMGTGTFTLARHANFACPWWQRWNHNATCRVFPNF